MDLFKLFRQLFQYQMRSWFDKQRIKTTFVKLGVGIVPSSDRRWLTRIQFAVQVAVDKNRDAGESWFVGIPLTISVFVEPFHSTNFRHGCVFSGVPKIDVRHMLATFQSNQMMAIIASYTNRAYNG